MTDEFFCSHCLEVTNAEDYPDVCPHCRVGRCEACQTRLKAAADFCHGCAAIPPVVKATMYRTSSYAGAYASENWAWEGLLHQSTTLPMLGDRERYGVSRGWETTEEMHSGVPPKTWLRKSKWGESMVGEKVRELTDAESATLGYRAVVGGEQ